MGHQLLIVIKGEVCHLYAVIGTKQNCQKLLFLKQFQTILYVPLFTARAFLYLRETNLLAFSIVLNVSQQLPSYNKIFAIKMYFVRIHSYV